MVEWNYKLSGGPVTNDLKVMYSQNQIETPLGRRAQEISKEIENSSQEKYLMMNINNILVSQYAQSRIAIYADVWCLVEVGNETHRESLMEL